MHATDVYGLYKIGPWQVFGCMQVNINITCSYSQYFHYAVWYAVVIEAAICDQAMGGFSGGLGGVNPPLNFT